MSASAIRILLVEDDHDDYEHTRDVIAEIKSPRDLKLEWIPRYEDALMAIAHGQYDVCLLDYFLGERHGLSFIHDAIVAGATVPIIFLTGRGDRSTEQSALAAGASDYLIKTEIRASTLERAIRHSIERGKTLAELRESERRFRAVFDHSLDAMLITNTHTQFVDGNAASLKLLGVTREQLLNLKQTDIAANPNIAANHWAALMATGSAVGELVLKRSDDGVRITELRSVANIIPDHHLTVLRDITVARTAELDRIRLMTIVDAADDAIDGTTLEGIINFWSKGAERLYGYSADEVIGRSKAMLMPPERAAELADAHRQLQRGESIRDWESLRRRKDGSVFEASIAMSPIREHDEVVGISVVTRDISAKKRLENHLAISDRMASVGTLAAGVAHEINNPLAAVVANVDLAMEQVEQMVVGAAVSAPDIAELRELLDETRAASMRIRNIVRDLKLLSRPDEDRRGAVDVRKVLDSSARMAWNEIRHRAELIREFGETPLVFGNDSRLGQVFLNLIVNAAHAIDEGNAAGNSITLSTSTDANGRAVVEVRDTGQTVQSPAFAGDRDGSTPVAS